jgi:hypothetical protein
MTGSFVKENGGMEGSSDRNYYNYYTEIEEYFLRRRGRNLLVSPLDWCLIELWRENGIPLHVVLRGIDRSFEKSASRGRRDPSTLYYCHPAIVEAFEEYREARIGSHPSESGDDEESHPEGPPLEEVVAHLDNLTCRLASRSEDACRSGAERLEALARELRRASGYHPAETERELESVYSSLVSELARSLDPEALKSIESELRLELKPYRKRLSKELYDRLREKRRLAKLGEHFGLPEMSLLRLGEGL